MTRMKPLAVIIPWFDSNDPDRTRAFKFVKAHIESMGIAEIFIGEAPELNRAAMRNNGAAKAIAKGYKKLFFNDADCLISKGQLIQAIDLMDEDGIVYPYNRFPVHLSREESQDIYQGNSFMAYSNMYTREIIPGAGNFSCNAHTFSMLAGLDEAFQGWGYEDSDFIHSGHRNIARTRTVDGPIIELYHTPNGKRESPGPYDIQGSNEWEQLERNRLRFKVKSTLGLLEWKALHNHPLLEIIVPAVRHGVAAKFMANTVWPVLAVVNNDPILGVEWQEAGATVLESLGHTFANKANYGFTQTQAAYTLYVGEDVEFQPNWYDNLYKYWGVGVIGTNDLLYSNELRSTHLIINRNYVKKFGGSWDGAGIVFHGYNHNYTDTETITKAKQLGEWTYAPDIIIKHNHWESPNSGVEQDEVYQLGLKTFNKDGHEYNKRYSRYVLQE